MEGKGLGYWVLGFGFRVSGLGFGLWVSGQGQGEDSGEDSGSDFESGFGIGYDHVSDFRFKLRLQIPQVLGFRIGVQVVGPHRRVDPQGGGGGGGGGEGGRRVGAPFCCLSIYRNPVMPERANPPQP